MNSENSELLKAFSEEQVAKLEEIIAKHKGKPGGLIPVLEEAQVALEYLPVSVQKKIAKGLNLPLSRVYGVVTFYSFFTMTPRGRHTVRVCLGTACYLRGAQDLIDEAQSILNIKGEEVTDDGLFSIDEVRCLGCCGLAPVLMIGNEVFGKVTKDQLPEIIAKYRNK